METGRVSDGERSLSHAEVRAEFGRIIAARSVELGQTVPPNTELLTIVELNRLERQAGVPTSRIPLIRLKQPVELTVDGFPGRMFSREVTRISPTADCCASVHRHRQRGRPLETFRKWQPFSTQAPKLPALQSTKTRQLLVCASSGRRCLREHRAC
ncbi:HlyD family efflux transporter periplasmic adaptor subunit [Sinorhizobium meliloti]|nr:HlyD family efflux transporter periplasmic adaptor subunit [Sinorhizobium meliloti]